jgi:uncharacterized coiled-coil DUF342 family protein
LESFLLTIVLGVLALYFFASKNVYVSLYKKVNEEKDILQEQNIKIQDLINKSEKQVKGSVQSLEDCHNNLHVAREDLQKLRLENTELKHKVTSLQNRVDELYAQVNTMV